MRFLILTQYFPPETGAPQVRLAAMIRELVRLQHQVEVVTALPNYPQGQIFPDYQGHFYVKEEWEGVVVHRVWVYCATGAGLKRLLNYGSFMFTALWGLKNAQKPDYLFVESPPLFLGITAYWVAKLWKIPFIFNVADLWPDSVRALGIMPNSMLLKLAEKLEIALYRGAHDITVVTESVRTILVEQKAIPRSKIHLLPNGVDLQLFHPQSPDLVWQQQLGLPEHKALLLYAGTQGYAHGAEVILQAAELLSDLNVLFLFIGGGSEHVKLVQLTYQMGLNNVLFWPPQTPEVINRFYSLAYAGLSTFRNSPWLECTRPAKTLPIMACGKPVIYSGAGEMAHLLTEAKAGLVVPPEDPIALANVIRELLHDPVMAQQLGEYGRRYVEIHLPWSKVVNDWLRQLIEHALANKIDIPRVK